MNSKTKCLFEPHGAARAFYNRQAGAAAFAGSPTLTCLCGWQPVAVFETWEAAGLALDKHIAESLKTQSELIAGAFEELREARGDLIRQKAAGRK